MNLICLLKVLTFSVAFTWPTSDCRSLESIEGDDSSEDGIVLLQSGLTQVRGKSAMQASSLRPDELKRLQLESKAFISLDGRRQHEVVLPMEGSLSSVMTVTIIYITLYVTLAVVHSFNQAQEQSAGPFERALESAVMGVCFAPMLCVLFFAVYKRAHNLASGSGLPEAYNLPPNYVYTTMQWCVGAFGVQTVLYVIKEWNLNKLADLNRVTPAATFWNTIFNLAMAGMYVATGILIYAVFDMKQPEELKEERGAVALSSGTFCSLCLVVLYFTVYAALHVAKTFDIWHLGRGTSPEVLQDPFRYLIEVLKLTATTIDLAPMLAVLLIATQLTVDATSEKLPDMVETSMYLCCFVLFVQVALSILTPFATAAELKVVPGRNDIVDFSTNWHRLFLFSSIIRWVCMAAMYFGIGCICWYLWRDSHEPRWASLVTHLATYFFVVNLAVSTTNVMRQLVGGGITTGIRTLSTAKDIVALCPMLAILFIESWVKAADIITTVGQPGQPQGYAQDYMFIASFALLSQLILTCINGLVWTLPKDSKVMRGCGHFVRAGLSAISFVFYLAMVTTYSSVLMVLFSLFTMSSQNADSSGTWFS
jgi:hypothetical protein